MSLTTPAIEALLRHRYHELEAQPPPDQLQELARLLADDVDDDARPEVESTVLDDLSCRRVLLAWAETSEEPHAVTAKTTRWVAPAFIALAAAAVLLAVLRPWAPGVDSVDEPIGGSDSVLVAKSGEPQDQFAVAARRGERAWRVRESDTLVEGDRIGFFYHTKHDGYLAVLHVDANGDVTTLFPPAGEHSRSISAGVEVALPDGAVVARAEGRCEWFVGVFSDRALATAPLRATLSAAARQARACRMTVTVEGTRAVSILGVRR